LRDASVARQGRQLKLVGSEMTSSWIKMKLMRYRLRTLLIVLALAPIALAGLLLYGERSWNEVVRWWMRPPLPRAPSAPPPSNADVDLLPVEPVQNEPLD
jgi:hypothetical protein